MHVNFRLWLSNWYNLLDVAIITLLVAASCLRYLLIFEGEVFEERGQVMLRLPQITLMPIY